jgi:general secretion pathway protein D
MKIPALSIFSVLKIGFYKGHSTTKIKAIGLFLACIFTCTSGMAQNPAKPVKFDFKAVNVAHVIQLIYGEVLTSPYVIDPELLADARLVSFRYTSDKGDVKIFVRSFLQSLGYLVQTKDGIDFIAKRLPDEKPDTVIEKEGFVYRPKYRDVSYLARLLSPIFQGAFSVNRAVIGNPLQQDKPVPDGSATAQIDQNADVLIFSGSDKEIDRLRKLLPQVDFQLGEVVVRGVVYEVNTSGKDGTAFGLLTNLIGGKLQTGIGNTNPIGSFLRFKNTTLDAVYGMLSQDNRFKVMSSPSLRIKSGAQGTFSVGQDVPVLGSVTYPANGQPVQSVEYRSSGVIFNIFPTVRESVIDIAVDQQLSNFAQTTTGVNTSPTLTKRALKTSIGMQDGDLIVLGGLTENKESDTRDGISFLPKFLHTTGKENSKSEILLVLQVQRL